MRKKNQMKYEKRKEKNEEGSNESRTHDLMLTRHTTTNFRKPRDAKS